MKIKAIALAVSSVGLVLGGVSACSGSSSPAPAETQDQKFLRLLGDANSPFLDDPTAVVSVAKQSCETLRGGETYGNVELLTEIILTGKGYTVAESNTLVRVSVAAYCPQYSVE